MYEHILDRSNVIFRIHHRHNDSSAKY